MKATIYRGVKDAKAGPNNKNINYQLQGAGSHNHPAQWEKEMQAWMCQLHGRRNENRWKGTEVLGCFCPLLTSMPC